MALQACPARAEGGLSDGRQLLVLGARPRAARRRQFAACTAAGVGSRESGVRSRGSRRESPSDARRPTPDPRAHVRSFRGGPSMKLQMVGCSHHTAPVGVRERLAFSRDQAAEALARFRSKYPQAEAVLLSTCNRVELYVASELPEACPSHHDAVAFLAECRGVPPLEIFSELFEHTGEDFVRHLFTVAASLDSMVVGEAQILAQVKQAYELATSADATGPLTNAAFQAALRVAKRVATETAIQQKRVSIPSVAVAEFAKSVFERFDDKQVLVIGAGEMGEEALRYLIDEGARQISLVNRSLVRAQELADKLAGRA